MDTAATVMVGTAVATSAVPIGDTIETEAMTAVLTDATVAGYRQVQPWA